MSLFFSTTRRLIFCLALTCALACQVANPNLASAQTAPAQTLPSPTGPVLLTVTGEIAVTNRDGAAEFDRAMLEALGLRELTTTTIWTEGIQVFSGVPLKALTDFLGVEGGTLRAIAINDYVTSIPYSDAAEDLALLAMDRNGAPMSVRAKGPIWVVYPFDTDPRFQSETYHARSIWQMRSIEVLP